MLQTPAAISYTQSVYNKVSENIIRNWINSPSQSLLHAFENVDFSKDYVPNIQLTDSFKKNLRWLVLMTNGYAARVTGLGLLYTHNFVDENGKSFHNSMSVSDTQYNLKDEYKPIADEVLSSVYAYIQNQKIAAKTAKLPKYVYRGIRFNTLKLDRTSVEGENYKVNEGRAKSQALDNFDLTQSAEGNFQSFTSDINIAKYFANGEGFVIKIELTPEMIVSSVLTEPQLQDINPYHNKCEKEYIIDVKEVKHFEIAEITDFDTLLYKGDINMVNYISHDDISVKAKLNGFDFTFYGYWKTNTKFKISVHFNNDHIAHYDESMSAAKKLFGKNFLNQIQNFEVYYRTSSLCKKQLIYKK
jgi:hypothetical protein